MVKKFTLLAVFFSFGFLLPSVVKAQCAYGGISYCPQNAPGMTNIGANYGCTNFYAGEYMAVTNVLPGERYRSTTCGSSYDTQLTLFIEGNGTAQGYNDDNGPACGGTRASLDWTSTIVGSYRVLLNQYFCATNSTNTTLYTIPVAKCAIAAESNPLFVAASGCSNGTFRMGPGAFFDLTVLPNTYYNFTFATTTSNDGFCAYPLNGNASSFSSNVTNWYSGTTTSLRVSANRTSNAWPGSSAIMTYRHSAIAVLGSPSVTTVDFCDASGNFTTPVTASGTPAGSVMWDWGSNNGVWNNNWIAGSSSGVCCFPKKVSNSDGNADRIRYRVINGGCDVGPSTVVLIRNRFNEAPSSLAITGSPACPSVGNITLTATFPSSINMNGTVEFFSGSCGGTLVGTATANPNSATAAVTIPTPGASTTYFVRYNPGTGSGCSPTACVSASFTANTLSVAPTGIAGTTTICAGGNTTLTVSGGSAGTGAVAQWYTGSCGGTLVGTGNSINVSPGSTTTYFVRYSGTCNTTTCASQAVTVNTLSTAPTSITGTSTICAGGSTTLAVSGGSLGTGGVWTWYSGSCGGTLVGTGTSVLVSPASATTYFVRAEGTCNTTTCASQAVTVNPVPTAFSANILTSTPLCYGSNARIEVPVSQSGTSYQLRDNTTNVGGAQPGSGGALTFTSNNLTATNGNYNVLATTGLGCTTVVNVASIGVDAIPSALGGNGDTRTCYVNGNNAFVEFRSASGSLIAINPGTENLGNVTVTEYVGSPLNYQACGTTQPWYVTAVLGRHWVITPQNQPTGPVTVRLYYDNSEYAALAAVANANANPNDDVAAQGSLDLSKYSNPGNPSAVNGVFTDNCASGGTTTAHVPTGTGSMNALSGYGSFPASGLYNQYSIGSFSEFWMSGTNNVSPLPIELQSFTASCDKGMVKLDWVTATEINNEQFTIHRSADLMEWEEVLSQVGAGNSNTPLAYTGVDERPLNGLSYYRLTQRDYDGTTESFEPISVTCYTDGSGNSMLVFPNPADDRFTVSVTVTEAITNAGIEILDVNGKRVMLRNVNLVKGTNEFTFDRSLMNPGTYFIKLGSGKLVLSPIKLIIK